MEGIELDGELRRADPDRWLTSRFIAESPARGRVVALYALDRELDRAVRVAAHPLAAEMRLTWWGEAIDRIFAGDSPRGHPVLNALTDAIRSGLLSQERFETMIEARIAALNPGRRAGDAAEEEARATQGSIAVLAAAVLGAADQAELAEPAGAAWGLWLLSCSHPELRTALRPALREKLIEGRAAAARLPVGAFPAVLPATLARATPDASGLEKRIRLAWASGTGRI